MTFTIEIPGRPVAKSRPRFGLGRTYTPERTTRYEELVAWHCRAARVRLGACSVEVRIELHSQSALRGDVDNYAKAVLDGLQKGEAIDNDRQVVALHVEEVVGEDEKTVVRPVVLDGDRVTRTPGTHGYVCECSARSCRQRLYLNPFDFERLARHGAVLHRDCARTERRTVTVRFGEVVAVVTGPRMREAA